MPTLKELIGYPTTYYDDDRISTTLSSVFLHLLRNDVDNDINQQNAEEMLIQGTNESQDEEREQSIRDIIREETGDSWLRQASENKARSRTSKKMDEERTLVTNAVNQEEDKRKTSSTSMYLKPTTVHGIPLASLTSSPPTRGFYITRSDNLPSSTFADEFTSSYTTVDSFIEQPIETALIPDLISTTVETVTVTHNNDIKTDKIVAITRNNQKDLEFDTFNDNVNDITKNKGVGNREGKSLTFDFSRNSDRTENLSTYTEPNTITIPVNRSTYKREKLLRNFDYNTTPLSNVYAISPTRSTRRRFTLGVIRQPQYNETSIPLWTSKRIVTRKRNRTVSLIKEAERRIDEDVSHTTTNIFKNASAIFEVPSTLTSAKSKLSPISTTPTIPLIMSESTMTSEILDVYNDSTAYSVDDSKIEDSKNRTNVEEAITLTNSIIAATPSISKIASITSDSTATIISTISGDFTSVTTMPSTANEAIITTTPSSTDAVVKAPMIASDQAAIMIESATKSAGIEFPVSMTANYSTADVPTTVSTHAITNDSVIIPVTTSIDVEITSPNANHPTDFVNMIVPATMNAEIQITSAITNYSVTVPTNTNAIVTDSAPTITISAENEIISTVADSVVATQSPATQEIATDPTITMSAAASTEVETAFTITNHPAFVIPATMIPATNTSSSTIISSTHATISATTSKLADVDTVTLTNMLTTIIPPNVVIPTINDSNVITPADVNVSSNFTITDTLTTSSRPKNNSVISSEDFVTSVDTTSTRSAVPTTLTSEKTTTHFNPNDFNVSNDSEISITTAKPVQTIEIPTTFETSPIFTSTVISRSLPSTNSATFFQMSENSVTSMITQIPSTLFSIITPINDIAAVEKSTLSAINNKSIATNIFQTTSTYKSSSVQMTSEESTTSRMKIASEEGTSRAISRKQNQTRSKLDDDQIGQKTSRRRINRTNNWLGRPVVQHTVDQYPLHRVTLHRERPRRPPGNTSKVVEQNYRRRIMQKRTRVNFQPISSTIRPDEDIIQNTTEDHIASTRARNVQRRIVSKRFRERVVEKETTTFQATTLLSQSIDNENESLRGKKARADPDFVDTNFQGNFSINFHANKNFSNKGNRGRRMRVLLRSKSEENNSTIEETSTSNIDENLRNNLSNNFSTSKNLANERKTRRRMRIVLRKKIRPKFEEEEAKIEEASANSDSTDKSLRGAFLSNLRRSKNFPDYKPRRRLRVVLKRIKPKFKKENSTAKETSVDSDSTDKDLQGSSSSNFHTNVNLSDEEETRQNIKSVSEEKDSIAEETIAHSDIIDKDISSNLHVSDNFPNREKVMTHFKDGNKEATVERLEDTKELQTTKTFVLVKEDTDQPSFEVSAVLC